MSDSLVDTAAPTPTGPARGPTLLANVVYAIGGSGLYHLCQLGVLVLLAKFTAAETLGQYLLGLAIATPVLQFFGLELRSALVADARSQFTPGTYHALRRFALLPAGLILLATLFFVADRELGSAGAALLAGVFALRVTWSLADVGWGTLQRRERLDLLACSVGLRGVTLLLAFVAVLLVPRTGDASGAGRAALGIWLATAASATILVLFDHPRTRGPSAGDRSWSWTALGALARQTFPLGLVALVITLCDSFPRLMFESPQVPDGKAQLGYFGSLAYVTLAGNLIIIQASTAAAHRLSRYYQQDLRAFLRLGARLTLAALGIGAAVVLLAKLCGQWLLTVLYTPEYAQFEGAFLTIVVAHGLALLTNVFGVATTQMRLFWIQVPVQLATLAATVLAAVLLIPGPTPVQGAAQTVLVRSIVQFILYSGCAAAGIRFHRQLLQAQSAR